MVFLEQYWHVLLPMALGGMGVYLLLPQPGPRLRVWGAAAGVLSLLLAGALLIHSEARLSERILFYAFSGMAILGGGLMLAQRNPVHAALSFALVVLSTCGLFLLLAAPFLMAATIIVYAGAIVVTFLFVIMLAQQAGLANADQRSREPFLASVAGFILMAALLCVLHKTYDTRKLDALLSKVEQVADAKSADEIKQVLGDPGKLPLDHKELPIIQDLKRAFPKIDPAKVDNAEVYWNQTPMDVAKLTTLFKQIHEQGRRLRNEKGSLRPADLKISPFSVANVPASVDGTARALPARNVAGLGRTLFTDFLLPVELAGVLLLVASIGAIAIAGRHPEGLR